MSQIALKGSLGGREAVTQFIYENLLPDLLSVDSPEAFNLQTSFASYLKERADSQTKLEADEHAEKWLGNLRTILEKELESWQIRDVPQPAWIDPDQRTLITWKHPNFETFTGFPSPGIEYFAILDWLTGLNASEFLVPNAVFLAHLGADRIYFTEGRGDEGIDLIGTIDNGPLKSTCIFIQAKTKANHSRISRDTVLLEYAKYILLPRTEKFREYRRTLNIDSSIDGNAIIYVITANTGFDNSAREVARQLGILLRSHIQLARFVQLKYNTIEQVREMHTRLKPHLKPDLSNNIVRFL